MSWIITIALIIVLLIAGFMLFFFMPKPRVFFDPYTNTIDIFSQNHDAIREEVLSKNSLDPVVPIYGFGEIKSIDYPVIYSYLRCIPCVRFAGIITIKTKFQQTREYGFADVANHTMRYFYTIKESAGHKSGIWIDGEKRFFTEKEWICGDMSREHSLFNKDKDQSSIVLFVDIDRHQDIHDGRSPNAEIKKDEILKMFEGEFVQGQAEGLTNSIDSQELTLDG